ncbi:MAG: 2'-5' RNA ligase family protein [Treponema sp.]|nr:2'-5' RNA ligase family protein [Treponema sp.]
MRIFIALPLPPDFLEQAEEDLRILRDMYPHWRWVTEVNLPLHITLAFLGELDDREAVLAQQALTQAVRDESPIAFDTESAILLPKSAHRGNGRVDFHRVNTLALEIAHGAERIAGLATRFEDALAETGKREGYPFRPKEKRQYTPHITLARKGNKGSIPAETAGEPFPVKTTGMAETAALFKSDLSGGGRGAGPRYTPLGIYLL